MLTRFKAYAAKTLLSLCAIMLLAPATAGAAGDNNGSFSDIKQHWARQTIEWAAAQGIADGYETDVFGPDRKVSEPEFLAMLIRTFAPNAATSPADQSGSGLWYEPYYIYAQEKNWMLVNRPDASQYNRGHVARLIASAQGSPLPLKEAVELLLDEGLSQGKYAATVEGYASQESLTRAEAVQFLRNAKEQGLVLKSAPEAPAGLQVGGISLGDTAAYVQAVLGEPDRKDASVYGFEWYVYNKDPLQYTLIGMRDGTVTGLYTSGTGWFASGGVSPTDNKAQVADKWGTPLSRLLKGNTWFLLQSGGYSQMFDRGEAYVTVYYDLQNGGQIGGVKMVAKAEEEQFTTLYGQPGDSLREAFEREILDLANAERAKHGIPAFRWNETAAAVARAHSSDMQTQGYFAHDDQTGRKPWDRAEDAGLSYSLFAENIAAGQTDALAAHYGWLNSTTGHRENLLGSTTHFGAGVAFGGKLQVYYTENFYTPY